MKLILLVITPRISASAYSNTAPLVWSFLYGSNHGTAELILDNAPSRSAELLYQDRVDVALVPVICAQTIEGVRVIPDVCVGSKRFVRSVCLVTNGCGLADVRSVALDNSSRTSAVMTKIVFREFLGFEPEWREASPDLSAMLASADAALIIGDPALTASASGDRPVFDLAELWHRHTGLGFIFAMWMTRRKTCVIDLAGARDEGLAHVSQIAANYASQLGLSPADMAAYLTDNIEYSPDESMMGGLKLYFELAAKHGLVERNIPLQFI
ncbi:MAG: menaquinone biosynthesis protein [Chloracidobacterium sp.]|nr:menaquinone biosynthesis protein [Chloracidobacterium sp.]